MTIARIGPEVLVNTFFFGAQRDPSIAALPDGRYIVTWRDTSGAGGDGSISAVMARIFNADGSVSVPVFLVNNSTSNTQEDSSVAVLPDGRFMVTWTDYSLNGGDLSNGAIRARIFNPDGSQHAPEFLVNTTTVDLQYQSEVTALPDGRFVVTWTDTSLAGGDLVLSAIRARIINADGTPSVAEFLVNTTVAGDQTESSITVLADGRFVISYSDTSASGLDPSSYAVRARIFNADGTESVPEFLVNTTTAQTQTESSIMALADGRFVVTYTDLSMTGGDTNSAAIRARIFNADGTQSVPEFVVNTTIANAQFESDVAALADGRFIVVWTDFSATGGDTSLYATRARIFNADGTQSVPEFLVNTTTSGDQFESSVAVLADGRIVISWTDGSQTGADVQSYAVRSQIFDPTIYDGTSVGDLATGGEFDDRYTGYGGNDTLSGRGGDDVLNGGEGDDTLNGDDGDDRLDGGNNGDILAGGNGADMIYGRSGIDNLNGGAGADNLWGGFGPDQHIGGDDAGIDYARYDDANYGNLIIRFDNSALNTGAAAGDTYIGIEGLVGGGGQDTIVGNLAANYLFGGGNADNIYGVGGADYLSGDAGGDNLWGGTGSDQHIGGNDLGVDYARYDDANYGNLTIRLDNAALNIGAAAVGDTYVGIEGLVGGAGADTIIGNAGANYLFGSAGNDFIDGQGGSDYLNGGADADRFRFSTALGAGNIDIIAGFTHTLDDIVLSTSIFTGLGATLTADEFRIGSALDANDRLLYNNITGQLFYDSNGNGAGGVIQFATVAAGTVLDVGDFVMA